jgi:hypothetical protein
MNVNDCYMRRALTNPVKGKFSRETIAVNQSIFYKMQLPVTRAGPSCMQYMVL